MKKYIIILLVFLSAAAHSQILQPINGYGFKWKIGEFDSTLHIPSFCGVPTLRSTATKHSAIAHDTCNNIFYVYNARTTVWDTVGGSSGSTFDSSTIYTILDTKLNVIDTTGKWLPFQIVDDTSFFLPNQNDSITRHIYSNGTFRDDTFHITSFVNTIINHTDSVRKDTTFVLSDSLNGRPIVWLTKDLSSRNDSLHHRMDSASATKDGYMTKHSWSLLGSGGPGGASVDSVRQTLGSDTIKQYTGGVGSKAYLTQRVFNIKDYGAVGDGVTDATASVQAAINAANAYGGKVLVPDGIYIIGGAINPTSNSQLYIPYSAITNPSRNCIIIEGESLNLNPYGGGLSGGAATPPPTTGAIFKSTLSTFTTAGQAVIGTSGSFNNTTVIIKNIGIQVKNNPSGTGPVVGGISWKKGSNFIISECYAVIDTAGFNSTAPANDVTGIESPDNSSGEGYKIENTIVGGFRSGYKIGEHVAFINSNAMTCLYGFNLKAGYHTSNAQRSGAYWCAYDVYVSGFCTLSNFQLDAEWQQIGKWYDDVATIKDSANLGTGQLFYTIIEGGVGKNNSRFLQSGGSINAISNDAGLPGLSRNNTFSGANTFSGINSFTKDNTFLNKQTFDSIAVNRINVGGVTAPTYKVEITSANLYDGLNIINTGTLGGARVQLTNNTGATGTLTVFDGTNATAGLPNNFGIGTDNDLLLTSGGGVSTGGTHGSMLFKAGGYSQEWMRLFSNGTFGIRTSTDSASANFIVNGTEYIATSTRVPAINGGIAANDKITIQGTTSGTRTTSYVNIQPSGGLVGIGTATPTYGLQVNSPSTVSGLLINSGNASIATFNNNSGGGNGQVYMNTGSNTNSNFGFQNAGATTWIMRATGTSGINKLGFFNSDANSNVERITLLQAGQTGFSQSSPTALVHMGAGTATASTAPLKFTAGTLLTTPESGAMETKTGNELLYSTSTTAASRGFIDVQRYIAKATSYTATTDDNTIDVTATGQTITLPTAVGIQGRTYTVKLTASGSGTVATTSSQTIDGSTTYSLSAQYKYVTVQSNNANWIIIANN